MATHSYKQPLELVYRPPKKNSQGGFSVYVSGKASDGDAFKIIVQTPRMRVPFGVNSLKTETGAEKFSLDLSFQGKGDNPDVDAFYDFIHGFDEKILDEAFARSREWFAKEMKRDVLQEFYRKMVKEAKDPKWADTFKVKLPYRYDRLDVELFDQNRKHMAATDVTAGCEAVLLIECSGLWFVNKIFGCGWNLIQGKIYAPNKINGYALRDLPEDAELSKHSNGLPIVPVSPSVGTKRKLVESASDGPAEKKADLIEEDF